MCGAVVTSPFDVVKTRLQSSMFQDTSVQVHVQAKGTGEIVAQRAGGRLLYHFVETGHILRYRDGFKPALTLH
jgi:solute carrier family 25 protein 33/36